MLVYLVLTVFCVLTQAARSPNADLVEELLQNQNGYYSNDVVEDAQLDVPDLVRKYGYPIEVHTTVTSDGYILETHRIPHGRDANNIPGPRPVVLIMHGLLCSSADFLVLGPGRALAYILAEAGYDVWLANARGNYYSRKHTRLNPDSRLSLNFWKFSWDEIGNLDVPAIVDHIILNTGQPKMHFIGYSQGGTVFYVTTSLRPEYNDKFISFQGLAPGAHVEHNENILRKMMVQFESILEPLAYSLGYAEVLGMRSLYTWIGLRICGGQSLVQRLCAFAVVTGIQVDPNYFNTTMLPVFIGHLPAGGAVRQIIHFAQIQRFNRFGRYNHGNPLANLAAYGRLTPPEYDLSKITVPTYLHYAKKDFQTDYRDIYNTAERLGNTIGVFRIQRETFNHFDFIWGNDAKEQLYDKVIESMKDAEARAEL